jgi:hypothetical protein
MENSKSEYRISKQFLAVIRISDYQVVGIRISEHQDKKLLFVFPDILVSGILHPDCLVF